MPTYHLPLNIIGFIAAFWTAVIHGIIAQSWLGAALWLTAGFAILTARRLTPPSNVAEETEG